MSQCGCLTLGGILVAVALRYVRRGRLPEDERGGSPADTATGPAVSDEDRILNILEETGGQVRQQHLVRETGWSETKVSRVVSRLAEQGDLQKLRIGRENLIQASDDSEPDR